MLERNCIEMDFKFNFYSSASLFGFWKKEVFFLPLFDHPSSFRWGDDDDDFSLLPFHVAINLSRLSASTRWKRNYTFLNKRQTLCLLIADISLVPSGSSSEKNGYSVISSSCLLRFQSNLLSTFEMTFCSPATWTMTGGREGKTGYIESEP